MEAERQQSRTGCRLSKYVGSTELQEKLQHRGKEEDGGMKDAVWGIREEEEEKNGRDGRVEEEGKASQRE